MGHRRRAAAGPRRRKLPALPHASSPPLPPPCHDTATATETAPLLPTATATRPRHAASDAYRAAHQPGDQPHAHSHTTATTARTRATLTPTASQTATPTSPTPSRPNRRCSGQIAFPRFDPVRGTYDVYVCRVDGSACRRVAAQASQPDLSGDGSQVVLHAWQPDRKGLVLQTLSGRRLWELTGTLEAARPSADPAGVVYVYHSRQESDRQPRLYRTYGAETRPLLYDGGAIAGQSPSWTPSGQILYSGCWQDTCGILAIDADGTHPRQIVAGSTETNPEASPDGELIAFMSKRDGNWEVYVVNADGSNLRRLTDHPGNDGLPSLVAGGRASGWPLPLTGAGAGRSGPCGPTAAVCATSLTWAARWTARCKPPPPTKATAGSKSASPGRPCPSSATALSPDCHSERP